MNAIIGITGQVGGATARALLKAGKPVGALFGTRQRPPPGKRQAPSWWRLMCRTPLRWKSVARRGRGFWNGAAEFCPRPGLSGKPGDFGQLAPSARRESDQSGRFISHRLARSRITDWDSSRIPPGGAGNEFAADRECLHPRRVVFGELSMGCGFGPRTGRNPGLP